ncbi:hypothetical protein QR680_012935 [Steinernema hermaphroditum]|uniref:Uncharacterized protein n=1 Tax=Steinernema hermaphroditum TaxID=289476 RepID=A0AA39I3T2_9BILA|nr:hypothetical protein QR680_012935 [Steinernema hermaphroditum]
MRFFPIVTFLLVLFAATFAQWPGAGIGMGSGGPGAGTPGFQNGGYMGAGAGSYNTGFGRKRRFAFIP